MSNLKKVVAVQCDGDWYVIPAENLEHFREISALAEVSSNYDAQDAFNMFYGHYNTGGDLNNTQLYAEI